MILMICARALLILVAFGCFPLLSLFVASGLESRIKLIKPTSLFVLNENLAGFSGTLETALNASAVIRGRLVESKGGRIESGVFRGVLSGVFDPMNLGMLALSGGKSFWGDLGTQVAGVTVSGANNQLGGWVELASPILFTDANSELALGLQNNLMQNLILNGGSLRLISSLELNEGIVFLSSGTVDLAEKTLILRSGDTFFSGNITWTGGGQIVLYDKLKLSGRWQVDTPSSAVTKINGFGRTLDFSLGGTMVVKSGCNLVFDNVVLQGLGSGSILLEDDTALVTFIGCSLVLDRDYTFIKGQILFIGKDSYVIAGDSVCTFSGSSNLKVDAVTLYFDPLSSTNQSAINVIAPSNILELHGGRVLSIHKKNVNTRMVVDDAVSVCYGHIDLTVGHPLRFRGLNSSSPVLQGLDLIFRCVKADLLLKQPLIIVDPGKQALIKDALFLNFDPACVQCGDAAELSFGNNVELNISRPIALTSTCKIAGNVMVRGSGDIFDISKGTITVASGASLVLQDLVLFGLGNTCGKIVLEDATASVVFKNVTLVLSDDYVQTKGKFVFQGTLSTIVTGSYGLSFKGSAQCIVDGVSVVYDPLAFPDAKNIIPSSHDGINLIYRKGGSVSLINDSRVAGSLTMTSSVYVLQRNESLLSNRVITFASDLDTCVIDGQGFALSFPFGQREVLSIPQNKRLELSNIVLKDFMWQHLKLDAGSKMAFGENVMVQLSRDAIITSDIIIKGKVVFDCSGNKLVFQDGCGFVFEDNGRLELRNGFLLDLFGDNTIFKMRDDSRLTLQDMECSFSNNFIFSKGVLAIAGSNIFSTHGHSFIYTSPSSLCIQTSSALLFDQDSIFRFDSQVESPQIYFADKTSLLHLNGSILSAGLKGLILERGTLQIDGSSVVSGDDGHAAYGIHFNEQTLDVNVSLKAVLDLQGLIVYE